MRRRTLLKAAVGALSLPTGSYAANPDFAPVVPGRILRFPEDEGSHPDFRTEWWYVTGWLDPDTSPLGFQVTFFRNRPHPDSGNPSRFDPREILIVHAAISDPAHGRLHHEQRVARAGFGLAQARTGSTDVRVDDWYLRAQDKGYLARIETDDFALDLRLDPTQAHMLQGDKGFSRKGPQAASASYYYSLPQLDVHGRVRSGKTSRSVRGSAWFDHEWSTEYMDPAAVGWDWTGINLDDGSALMAFRMRARNGAQHWAAATLRPRGQESIAFAPNQVAWSPTRHWRSPRSGASYPVAMQIRVDALTIDLEPLMDDQENDTRLTTGAVYWEGAVTALQEGRRVGRGYLELTGYSGALKW